MPDIDGLEIARIVKQQFSDVQVVIITGYPTAASAAEAQELGVFHYVPKPLTPDQLVAITAAAVAFPPKRCLPTVRKPAAPAAPDEPQPREVSPPAEPEPPDRPAEPAEEPPRMLAAPDRPTEVADEAADQRSHPSGDLEQPLNTVCRPSPLRIALLLTAAPLIGLAYILILPILGFGMLLSAFGLGLLKAVSVFKK
ncbi:MAG: response regulator [Planctomycetes bacterium]|nr:response regulator [Planctomycetota bacterium]